MDTLIVAAMFVGPPMLLGLIIGYLNRGKAKSTVENELETQTWLMWRDRLDRYRYDDRGPK